MPYIKPLQFKHPLGKRYYVFLVVKKIIKCIFIPYLHSYQANGILHINIHSYIIILREMCRLERRKKVSLLCRIEHISNSHLYKKTFIVSREKSFILDTHNWLSSRVRMCVYETLSFPYSVWVLSIWWPFFIHDFYDNMLLLI